MEALIEEKHVIQIINETYQIYLKNGSRSSKKVDYFHTKIKAILLGYFEKDTIFDVKTEYNIDSCNATGKKKCDIVILKNKIPYIIFPIKVVMTNYKQNKNNFWENLTGEVMHIKWFNKYVNVIPINIFMNKTPYLKKDKQIKKFEIVEYEDIKNYNLLKENDVCYDVINYIVNVDHDSKIGELFNSVGAIKNFNKNTKYRCFKKILSGLI